MIAAPNVDRSGMAAKRAISALAHRVRPAPAGPLAAVAVTLALLAPAPAHAVDGCLVLLCLAAPNWRGIGQCVPPVLQVFRDLARGRPFPTCGMSGAGNSASHAWASAPTFCPPQYSHMLEGESAPVYLCDYTGAISVSINGSVFARTWWSFAGESVTEFSPAAKTLLGSFDSRFDDDYARWLASQTGGGPTVGDGGGN